MRTRRSSCHSKDLIPVFSCPVHQLIGEQFDFIEVIKTDLMKFLRCNLLAKVDHSIESISPGLILVTHDHSLLHLLIRKKVCSHAHDVELIFRFMGGILHI